MPTKQLLLHAFVPRSRANGPGVRAVIWTRGCTLQCPHCFNDETHDRDGGQLVTVDDLFAQICALPEIEGVTLSGGEPLQQPGAVLELLRRIKTETSLSTLMFSGFSWAEIVQMSFAQQLPALLDVLIAGRYVAQQRIAAGLIGSANKQLLLFSPRYTLEDLAQTPATEVIIKADGTLILTGIDPLPLEV